MRAVLDTPCTMLAIRLDLGRKHRHHRRSDRKPAFKRILWCNSLTHLESSIMCRRNNLPGRITQQACWSWSMTDKSSLLEQDYMLSQRRISLRRHCNFDGGRLRVMNSVSISIPRKVSLMLGPSVFLEATGTPKNTHRASTLRIAENLGLQRPGSLPCNGDRPPHLSFPVFITPHLLLRYTASEPT